MHGTGILRSLCFFCALRLGFRMVMRATGLVSLSGGWRPGIEREGRRDLWEVPGFCLGACGVTRVERNEATLCRGAGRNESCTEQRRYV